MQSVAKSLRSVERQARVAGEDGFEELGYLNDLWSIEVD
jgi:hypothetical protein